MRGIPGHESPKRSWKGSPESLPSEACQKSRQGSLAPSPGRQPPILGGGALGSLPAHLVPFSFSLTAQPCILSPAAIVSADSLRPVLSQGQPQALEPQMRQAWSQPTCTLHIQRWSQGEISEFHPSLYRCGQ